MFDIYFENDQVDKTAAARLVGIDLAAKTKQAGVTEVCFDRGRFLYHGRVKALADAAREAEARETAALEAEDRESSAREAAEAAAREAEAGEYTAEPLKEDSPDVLEESDEPIEEPNELVEYITAFSALEALLQQKSQAECNAYIRKLMFQVERLKNEASEPVPVLTDVLNVTYQRLIGEFNPVDYEKIANTMQGKASMGMKVLGGIMLALGIAVAALGIVFSPVLVLATATVMSTTAAIALTGVAVGSTSASLAIPGVGFFAQGLQTGLSKAMCDVDHHADQTYEPISTSFS